MNDQPIAFKDEMIRALFNETCQKTQTRRLNLKKHYFIGQKLWVKEDFRALPYFDDRPPREIEVGSSLRYEADCMIRGFPSLGNSQWGRIRVARFMPRWASRITLEVTALREERLQDISDDDAMAEGIYKDGGTGWFSHGFMNPLLPSAKDAYQELWQSINGPGSWDENPVVRVISFRMVK